MTRCASEDQYSADGLAWTPPDPLPLPIETPRLVIRAYEVSDAAVLFRTIETHRQSLLPWMPWARVAHKDIEQSLSFILGERMHMRELDKLSRLALGVFDRESGELLGGHGIHDIRRDSASCESGYWLAPTHQRKGLATEATRHMLSWALRPQDEGGMGLNRVRIYCSDLNERSLRIPQRIGLRREVEQREDYYVEGVGLTARLGWGVLASEWDTTAHELRDQA